MTKERAKKAFVKAFVKHVRRPGAAELLGWLEGTDFFSAPASTRHHLAYPCGLVEHSVNVFRALGERIGAPGNWETVAVCGLLHDVCKANYYVGEKAPYTVKDQCPMGHGEKSVYLIQRFMELTEEEALAIRWHMGAWDEAVRGGSRGLNEAMAMYPLVYELHAADMRATHEIERGK